MQNIYKFNLFTSIIMLSTAPIFVRMATIHPMAVGVWRMIFTSIILSCILFFKRDGIGKGPKTRFLIFVPAGFFLFLHFYTWFLSINSLPIALAVIIYATNPLFTALGNRIFFKEEYHLKYFFAFIISFLGIYISYRGSLRSFNVPLQGLINIVLSAMFYSAYLLISKLGRLSWSNTSYNLFLNVSTLIFFTIAAGFFSYFDESFRFSIDLKNLYATMGMAIFPSLLGHTLFIGGLSYFSINAMSSFKLITPLISSLFAWIILDEQYNSDVITGMFVALLGLSLIYIGPNLRKMITRFFR